LPTLLRVSPANQRRFCSQQQRWWYGAITGPIFHYSDSWQLVINTGTTIITFLMVFLIQNTQNRDNLALQVKLDELILATKAASNDW
jgi:low affinity Fe/Cu permease